MRRRNRDRIFDASVHGADTSKMAMEELKEDFIEHEVIADSENKINQAFAEFK